MFRCSVDGCDREFNQQDKLFVHTSHHEYHEKIKEEGRKELAFLQSRLNMRIKCPHEVDPHESNYKLPQLPMQLICEWEGCEMEFYSAANFYEHVSDHPHRSLDKCYWKNCTREFSRSTITLMREHLRVHTLQKLFACPDCGNFFSTKIKFDDHFLRHIQVPDNFEKLIPKSVTGHAGGLEFVIEEYMIDGSKVELFRCTHENCNKTFLTSSLVREHIQMHSSRYKCDSCSFIAKSASKLESHKLYRHQTERKYECPLTSCKKTFKQIGDLRAHLKRHLEPEIPYICGECGFEALNEEGYTKHLKQHSNNHYYCHICQKTFSRGNNLSRHFKDQHELEPPNGLCRFRYKLINKDSNVHVYILDTGDDSLAECVPQGRDQVEELESALHA